MVASNRQSSRAPPFNMPNESLVKRPEARLQDLLSRDLLRGALAALTQENVATRTPFLSEHALPQRPHAEVAGAGGHKPGVLRRRLTISGSPVSGEHFVRLLLDESVAIVEFYSEFTEKFEKAVARARYTSPLLMHQHR
jgi:hypothetical protein